MNMPSYISETAKEIEIRKTFMKWQCRVRQIAMRDNSGQPDDGMMPMVKLGSLSSSVSVGSVITLIHKRPQFSVTAELKHMSKKTFDPAQRREQAIKFLSSTFYQKHAEFSDILTATFRPNSVGANKILNNQSCFLIFDAFSQRYDINCQVKSLNFNDPYYQSTFAHNLLFNPQLHPETIVLAFLPNWKESFSVH